jgi:hypothetical protein
VPAILGRAVDSSDGPVQSVIDGSWPLGLADCAKPGRRTDRPLAMSNSRPAALNMLSQRPQRTQPSETLSWSGTTRNTVPQDGQRVARLIAGRSASWSGGGKVQPWHWAVIRIQPSSLSLISSASQGA